MGVTWKERLQTKIYKVFGPKKGAYLEKKYLSAFPPGYRDEYKIDVAITDIKQIETLSNEKTLSISLYYSTLQESTLHLRIYQWKKPIPLSDILPMLENFNLRTYSEQPHEITFEGEENQCVWISDFIVVYPKNILVLKDVQTLFQDAFSSIYFGLSENDGFNKLVLAASLSWREIIILRAYAKYLRQVGFRFSQAYIEKALANNPAITRELINLFLTLFNPTGSKKNRDPARTIENKILQSLQEVPSLDEDKIIRRLLDLIKATLRTNYFQMGKDGLPKDYLSIKLKSKLIPELPEPIPLYEIFVYSRRFEGIHLRNKKVARGGIRWSDRLEDFRTEILGLMKAQKVKNAVIVPSGAKGGFVLKESVVSAQESLQDYVIECYKSFICGLLDLTDNIKEKEYVPPKNVVCFDDHDAYLVVAADKGTASFSDIANSIAKEYDFWLGDAFASGGSTGYDHKKMGITARGAWESIKRHFREIDIDVNTQSITVVGIGDMSGDVFGNGMIYSDQIKLVCAFDHRHIFIDPTPDQLVSFQERLRLFNLPRSSWEDYNSKLISKGGGVFKRSIKSISLTSQMKKLLNVRVESLAPNELIRAILRAPVDLLYNGGIGTYVKASIESDAEVGDRANDYCRVNGDELRCKVVGEGGNLGFTQLGRVEYALKGGLINTDFIDNSGGVDCSDHEVNLKILLDQEVQRGKLTEKQRNNTLVSVTQEIVDLVLSDNYQQALVMSFSTFHAKKNLGLYINYIKELESIGVLNRKVEFLPDDKKLLERKTAGETLTSPELAVILAYTKIHIKQSILKSNLSDDPFISRIVTTAFPPSLAKKYYQQMLEHRLHKDITATQLSNQIVNEMGLTFIYRQQMETSATVEEIVRAYILASRVFLTEELRRTIESLDFKIPIADQYDMLFNIRNLINLATRWFLHGNHLHGDLETRIKHYANRIHILEDIIPNLMVGATKDYLGALTEKFVRTGLSEEIARRIATYRAIYTSLNIIDVATLNHFDLIKTAKVYFACGDFVNLVWFRDHIANDARDGHWNILARLTLRDELDISQRALTIAIMSKDKKEEDVEKLIQKWAEKNKRALDRWDRILNMLHESTNIEYTMFFIALRELLGLIMSSV